MSLQSSQSWGCSRVGVAPRRTQQMFGVDLGPGVGHCDNGWRFVSNYSRTVLIHSFACWLLLASIETSALFGTKVSFPSQQSNLLANDTAKRNCSASWLGKKVKISFCVWRSAFVTGICVFHFWTNHFTESFFHLIQWRRPCLALGESWLYFQQRSSPGRGGNRPDIFVLFSFMRSYLLLKTQRFLILPKYISCFLWHKWLATQKRATERINVHFEPGSVPLENTAISTSPEIYLLWKQKACHKKKGKKENELK